MDPSPLLSNCIGLLFLYVQRDPSPRVTSTAMRENKFYVTLYLFWSKFILIEIIPYTTILILNIFIIIKITKSARFRKKFQRQADGNEEELEADMAVVAPLSEDGCDAETSSNGSRPDLENEDDDYTNEDFGNKLQQKSTNGIRRSGMCITCRDEYFASEI